MVKKGTLKNCYNFCITFRASFFDENGEEKVIDMPTRAEYLLSKQQAEELEGFAIRYHMDEWARISTENACNIFEDALINHKARAKTIFDEEADKLETLD